MRMESSEAAHFLGAHLSYVRPLRPHLSHMRQMRPQMSTPKNKFMLQMCSDAPISLRNLIDWTWRRTMKHTESRSRIPDGTMVNARWRDGTMVKTRWYERETTMVRWRNNEDTMMKTLCHDGENTMLRWWKNNGTIMKLRRHDDEKVILFSPLCHRIILISQSCHRCYRVFICTIVPSCIAVQRGKQMFLASKRNTVLGQYLNDTISWLVSHLARISRLATRKSFEAIYR
jgi:hypothetical protein